MSQKSDAALILYREGWTQKEIAQIIKSTEKTVSNWRHKFNWDEKTVAYNTHRQTSEDNALAALAHQTKIIRLIAEKLGDEVTNNLSAKELAGLLIPKGEIDAVQKLFTTIKRKELDWSDKVKTLREFATWLKEVDIELAKQIIGHIDTHLNETRR